MPDPSLVVVLDGLRPDYVDPELTPNLCALREEGVVGRRHHAAYPSKTRVQSASVATGCFPGAHGLVDNSLWLPEVDDRPVDTGDARELLRVDREIDGALLTAPSLGEVLEAHDRTLFAAGSCTTGANLLLDHRRTGAGVCNARGFVVPDDLAGRVERAVGPSPDRDTPNVDQNRWAVDAYLEVALEGSSPPDVSFLWLSDPDITMHEYGVGHPRALEAVRRLDDELGRLFEALERRGAWEQTDTFVLADHGFSTDRGGLDVPTRLAEEGLDDRVTVVDGTQVYLEEGASLERVVRSLRGAEGVGAVFARPGAGRDGLPPGAFPLEAANVDHPRTADVLVAPDWSDESNDHGYPGTTSRPGIGGHGTLSPYETRVRLIGTGPNLKTDRRSEVPSGHVDVAPTLLHLQGVSPPDSMDGRVLHELLEGGSEPPSTGSDVVEAGAPGDEGSRAVLERARAGGVTYPAVARIDRTT